MTNPAQAEDEGGSIWQAVCLRSWIPREDGGDGEVFDGEKEIGPSRSPGRRREREAAGSPTKAGVFNLEIFICFVNVSECANDIITGT